MLERRAPPQPLVPADDLGDLLAHRIDRIEGGHRLLEDDGDLLAADVVHLIGPQRHQVPSLPEDLPGDDAPRRHRDQLQDGERGDGLAATGLAHDTQRLLSIDGEVDAVHGLHHAVVGGEMGLEAADLQQWLAHHITLRGSSASRRPSPMKLMVSTARKIAAPGKSAQCGAMSR